MVDPFAAARPAFSQNAQGQWVIPRDRWDPVGAAIVALIPDANATAGGQPIYASTPITDTRQDQFDVRIDHQFTPKFTIFGRYSFVDTLTFRPAPLPGLAEGSFNDAFGSNDNRSQGLALGATWTLSPTFVGDIRFGASRGDYYTYPPNFGIDGAAEIGLKNVPNDPGIVGGVPKVNIQGFDAVGRHTSTPQFQTPRTWNPRATFSLSRKSHFIKFGAEFLKVSTRINDLNATVGRMNFENRFTNRAVGDLLLGLPAQLALTSFTVMDQGQSMQFYFVQDDYRLSEKLTANLGVRYEYATPPLEKDNQFANFDPATGTMIFAKDGSVFERALIHPDRNNFAPRVGFAYAPGNKIVVRGGYGIFYTHTVRQGREGLLGFNPPYLIDNLLQTSVSGAAAVASAAPFRLINGYPSGLLDPGAIAQTVGRRAQDANQRTPYIQQFNIGAQYKLRPDVVLDVAYVGNKGTKLNGFRNLNQRAVITNPDGSQSAGARPYPSFGDIQWMENRVSSTYKSLQARLEKRFSKGLSGLVSYTLGEALTGAPDHISTSGGGPGFDTGVFREPQDGNNLRAEYGPSEFDITHRLVASYVWELPFGSGRHFGSDWTGPMEFLLGGWQLTGIHVAQSGLALTATLGGTSVLNIGGERRARPNLVGDPVLPESERTLSRYFNTDAFAVFSPGTQAFGNAGIGLMRGPAYVNFDFSLAKTFRMNDRRSFQFRTELFNAFNHPNFGPPNIQRESSGFGQILTAGNGRIIQFGLKFYFWGRHQQVVIDSAECERPIIAGPGRFRPAPLRCRFLDPERRCCACGAWASAELTCTFFRGISTIAFPRAASSATRSSRKWQRPPAGVGFSEGDRVVVEPLIFCGTCRACRMGASYLCYHLKVMGVDAPGGMQEYWAVPTARLLKVPDSLSDDHAALIEPLAIATHDVARAQVKRGDTVVVFGGGPIGCLIALVCRHRECARQGGGGEPVSSRDAEKPRPRDHWTPIRRRPRRPRVDRRRWRRRGVRGQRPSERGPAGHRRRASLGHCQCDRDIRRARARSSLLGLRP